jgi:hypothetical protein
MGTRGVLGSGRSVLLMTALLVWMSAADALHAQIGTAGAFVGTVRDESGAVLPGATVTATHVATSLAQTGICDGAGRFNLPSLPAGEYRVEASLSGFRPHVYPRIILTVARTQEVNFTLSVGDVSETVDVVGGTQLVETQSSSVAGVVSGDQIRDLPLNGRSFDELITLSAGTVMFSQRLTNAFRGTTDQFSATGTRPGTTRLVVDGSELAGAGGTHTNVSTASGKLMGVEGIQEFAVVTSNGDASIGKKPGGQVNIVTRSGTNLFRGSGYEFLRNNAFDATDYFATALTPLHQDNYGVSVGGPIVENRTFFFANLEQYRERRTLTLVSIVPSMAVRQGIMPNGSVIPVNPVMRGILNLYPVPQGRDFGDGTAQATTQGNRTVDDRYLVGRLDHTMSSSSSLFVRYLIQTGERFEPNDNGIGAFLEDTPFRTQLLTVGHKEILSNKLLNQLTLTANRGTFAVNYVLRPDLNLPPEMILLPGQVWPGGLVVNVQGGIGTPTLPTLGGAQTSGSGGNRVARTVFQISDQISYASGSHNLVSGFEFQRIYSDDFLGTQSHGQVQFASLQGLVSGVPSLVRGPLADSVTGWGWRQFYVAPYIQDSYKLRPTFTLNLGLRWEFMSDPVERNGHTSAFVPIGGIPGGPLPNQATLTDHVFAVNKSGNFAPRVGFAWDVFGTGRTAVRGGAGLFYSQIENEFRYALTTGPPYWNQVQLANPPFPNPGQILTSLTAPPVGSQTVAGLQQDPDIPESLQFNLRLEQAVAPGTVVAVTYTGSRGSHYFRVGSPQVPAPFLNAAGRLEIVQRSLNPTLNPGGTYGVWDAKNSYNGVQLELDKRLSHGLRFKTSFTWSRALDEGCEYLQSDIGGCGSATLVDHTSGGGPAPYNVPRRLVTDWTYNLPLGTHTGVAGQLLNDWQFSGILQAQDGFPFTVVDGIARSFTVAGAGAGADRPDLVAGRTPSNIILGGTVQYFDPTAFVLQPANTLGNLGAHTLLGPGLFTVDSSLSKSFHFAGTKSLQLRVDCFNLTNRANFGLPDPTLFAAGGVRRAAAGSITSLATGAREFQFGVKLNF